jgi:hypothetical protein
MKVVLVVSMKVVFVDILNKNREITQNSRKDLLLICIIGLFIVSTEGSYKWLINSFENQFNLRKSIIERRNKVSAKSP